MNQRRAALSVLALLLLASLAACSPKAPEGSEPVETPTVQPTGTPAPPAEPTQSAPPPTDTPDPAEDPEDPDNMAVGERDTTLTVVVEGVEEIVPAVRHTSWLGYAITYDPAMFTLNEDDGGDVYLAEMVEGRPNVYLSVSTLDGLTADEAVESLREMNDIEAEGQTVSLGANRYAAAYLKWSGGAGGNDPVSEFYVTEQNGTVFLVELGNFVDGLEGYGARLDAMLATITF